MRRFVRVTGRLLVLSALLGGLIRIGRTVLGRRSDTPGDRSIRTGSFDAWPPVPVAPADGISDAHTGPPNRTPPRAPEAGGRAQR